MSVSEKDEVKQVTFTNLQLLGFDAAAMERKMKIPFNKDMFNLPNKKGFEMVIHFLFTKLDSVKCKEQFRGCWPVVDRKCEQMFRKKCHEWLSAVANEDGEAHLPHINPSLLMAPGGDKFCQMLLSFSRYVLYKSATGLYGAQSKTLLNYPTLTPQTTRLCGVVGKVLMSATARHRQRLLDHTEATVLVQDSWKLQTRELVKEYRALSKAVREREKELAVELKLAANTHPRRSPGQLNTELLNVKWAQKVHKIREQWKLLEEFAARHEQGRLTVDSVVDGEMDKYKIDASQLNIRVPDILLQECQQEIHRRNVENIYQGGKVNLISLIHLWNLSLHLYIEKLHQVGVAKFEEVEPALRSQLHTQQAHLSGVEALRSKVEHELIPKCKASIDVLKKKLDLCISPVEGATPHQYSITGTDDDNHYLPKKITLGLTAPTPPVTFDPASTPSGPSQSAIPDGLIKRGGPEVATPDAASQLVDSIQEKVRCKQGRVIQGSAVFGPRTPQEKTTAGPTKYKRPPRVKKSSDAITNDNPTTLNKPVHSTRVKSTLKTRSIHHNTERSPMKQAQLALSSQHTRPNINPIARAPQHNGNTERKRGQACSQRPVKPHVDKHTDVLASSVPSPQAHELLAEQIAEAVVSGSGDAHLIHSLINPTDALDTEAFVSKDKLARTPTKEAARWGGLLMEDSFGPLSSTRIESRPVLSTEDRPQAERVAQKLFSNQHSDAEEDHSQSPVAVATVDSRGMTPAASTPTARHRRASPVGAELLPPIDMATPSSIHSVQTLTSVHTPPHSQDVSLTIVNPRSPEITPPLARAIDFDLEVEDSSGDHSKVQGSGVQGQETRLSGSQEFIKAEELITKAICGLRQDLIELSEGSWTNPAKSPPLLSELTSTDSPYSKTPCLPRLARKHQHSAPASGKLSPSEVGSQGFETGRNDYDRQLFETSSSDRLSNEAEVKDSSHLLAAVDMSGIGLDDIEPPDDLDADFQLFATSAHTPQELFDRLVHEEGAESGQGTESRPSLLGTTPSLVGTLKLPRNHQLLTTLPNSDSSDIGEDQVRAITFQNGSFNEVLDKSPVKTLEREEFKLRTVYKEDSLTSKLEAELELWREKGLVSLSPPAPGPSPFKATSLLSHQNKSPSSADSQINAPSKSLTSTNNSQLGKSTSLHSSPVRPSVLGSETSLLRRSFVDRGNLHDLQGPGIDDEDVIDFQNMSGVDSPASDFQNMSGVDSPGQNLTRTSHGIRPFVDSSASVRNSSIRLHEPSPRSLSGFAMSPVTHSLHLSADNHDPLLDDQWNSILGEGDLFLSDPVPTQSLADPVPTANLLGL